MALTTKIISNLTKFTCGKVNPLFSSRHLARDQPAGLLYRRGSLLCLGSMRQFQRKANYKMKPKTLDFPYSKAGREYLAYPSTSK